MIVMWKQKRILSFFGPENKRDGHRPQTETSRTDNVDKDKSSDTDEHEPFVEPKAKTARRNFQSTWLEKFKYLWYNNTKGVIMEKKKGKENFQEKPWSFRLVSCFVFVF